MEELMLLPNGAPLTTGPGRYKIPGMTDIPRDFRVQILKGSRNPHAIHASKGLGEPPLCLGTVGYYALKQAVYAARKEQNIHGYFGMKFPATCESIRMGCRDGFTDLENV
jgi:xanthine dehydrogenase/oxidase